MSDNSDLGNRMKRYENIPRIALTPRMPMIIRVDGRAFHTYTRRFKPLQDGPWSIHMRNAMTAAAEGLMKEISGAKIAYVQSDEISVLVTDYDTFNTQAWFDKGVQKVCSVSASVASVNFNASVDTVSEDPSMATFDARCFVLPKEEVNNYFLWRQQDASKNSVSMLAQWHFSHKSLQNKNGSQMQDMLMLEKSINWNDLPVWQKRGWCVLRTQRLVNTEGGDEITRTSIQPDWEIPIFTKDREYVEKHVNVG